MLDPPSRNALYFRVHARGAWHHFVIVDRVGHAVKPPVRSTSLQVGASRLPGSTRPLSRLVARCLNDSCSPTVPHRRTAVTALDMMVRHVASSLRACSIGVFAVSLSSEFDMVSTKLSSCSVLFSGQPEMIVPTQSVRNQRRISLRTPGQVESTCAADDCQPHMRCRAYPLCHRQTARKLKVAASRTPPSHDQGCMAEC